MNFSGLGGIAIAIIAGAWLFVLLPRWADGTRAAEKSESIRAPRAEKTQLGERGLRLQATKRFASLVAVTSALATFALFGFASVNQVLLFWLFATIPVGAMSAWLAWVSAATMGSLKPARVSERPRVKVDLKTQLPLASPAPDGVFDQRAWVPNAIPEPLNNRLGQLRQHAPVVSFEQVKTDSELVRAAEPVEPVATTEINVTEILKRRRVI